MAESDIARYNSPTKEIEKSATRADSIMHGQGVRPGGDDVDGPRAMGASHKYEVIDCGFYVLRILIQYSYIKL